MTNDERREFKELIVEVIAPMFESSNNAHEALAKDIKILFKQSAEHYSNKDRLEERMSKQVHECQVQTSESSKDQGERIAVLNPKAAPG